MAIDDVSMWLAYKLFEIAKMADGQESSTRYISLKESGLPEPEVLGIPPTLAADWRSLMLDCFGAYFREYNRLEALAEAHPEKVRYPVKAKTSGEKSGFAKITPWIGRGILFPSPQKPTWLWS